MGIAGKIVVKWSLAGLCVYTEYPDGSRGDMVLVFAEELDGFLVDVRAAVEAGGAKRAIAAQCSPVQPLVLAARRARMRETWRAEASVCATESDARGPYVGRISAPRISFLRRIANMTLATAKSLWNTVFGWTMEVK